MLSGQTTQSSKSEAATVMAGDTGTDGAITMVGGTIAIGADPTNQPQRSRRTPGDSSDTQLRVSKQLKKE